MTILRGGEYAAAPPRSPEADAAWREAQAASDAAQMAGETLRAAHTKAARDKDVADVQAAAQGLRAIAARMLPLAEGGR